ncbi:SDR family oxidoreductase [Antrihabitans sp. YC2-6]|uniref:SDR family oxidoreductase n=1 Tax=Antrihabitans sp. YC2-6 TaxID=2799498 RepID=UPI0018F73305|nr:SDR family oxidoreductase [Antrihabitans sp. YC2-6]MBJ8344322.1 SDR family oxidoreductase [Antrihabitans sp. YC2-6]
MDLGIRNKVALVLGGGGGLGRAIATTLSAEGAAVAISDKNEDALEETTAQLQNASLALKWDLADLDAVSGHITTIEDTLGPVDILVNITGGPPPTPVSGQDVALWGEHFRSMVLSVIAISDRVLPGMKERGWGRLVTSASSGVITPIPNLGLSNALRSALVGWSKTLSQEVGRHGITSNVIVPGRIATKRITFLDEAKAKRENRPVADVTADSVSSISVGRYGDPQEYADAVAFLASTRAAYITGSVLRVDGGLIASV